MKQRVGLSTGAHTTKEGDGFVSCSPLYKYSRMPAGNALEIPGWVFGSLLNISEMEE